MPGILGVEAHISHPTFSESNPITNISHFIDYFSDVNEEILQLN